MSELVFITGLSVNSYLLFFTELTMNSTGKNTSVYKWLSMDEYQ
jgi:hypothetical protein